MRSIFPVDARVANPVTTMRKSAVWNRCSISGGAARAVGAEDIRS